MRESFPPARLPSNRDARTRAVLCGATAVLLGPLWAAPTPAGAAPALTPQARAAPALAAPALTPQALAGPAPAPQALAPRALAAPASAACGPAGGPAPTERPWALDRLKPESVWPISRGAGVTVAVIDSGVSAGHPALRGRVREGRDFSGLPQRQGRCDQAGHGTVVAGIIAGRDDTDAPFSGIAPEAAILPLRVLPDTGETRDPALPGQIAQAVRWAADHDADVINLSLVTEPAPELEQAIGYALSRKIVVVAAAGNSKEQQRQDLPAYPASYPGVIAVAGVDEQGAHVGTSISGEYVDVAAPGLNLIGPAPRGDGYLPEPDGGTSFAAAYVSGVVALLRAAQPDLTPDQVTARLTGTADSPPEGKNTEIGYGVVDPYRAVTTLLGVRADPPPGAMPALPAREDPSAWQRTVALWVALAGLLLAALLLVSRPILAHGRRRGWRPGRRPAAPVTDPTG
ncbi:type VII secretion-associated serine protease mycosin [Micromonospora siamensis]|uniref:Type VII secretion-associated serine protease mycosin n=1 Tax=Micromonospora siamensis TaxID=299152 RepID=A0A1C5H6I0_9ACTN|nr:type VII secretion-associated serine protease mycosin [Micromonospora siamensis]SCG41614.1 type VII secretion-associated serine protease mycosin [Micromonospora siamensis]